VTEKFDVRFDSIEAEINTLLINLRKSKAE
jgi:hypothetical protein